MPPHLIVLAQRLCQSWTNRANLWFLKCGYKQGTKSKNCVPWMKMINTIVFISIWCVWFLLLKVSLGGGGSLLQHCRHTWKMENANHVQATSICPFVFAIIHSLPSLPGASVVVVLVHAIFILVPADSTTTSDPELGGIILEDVTISWPHPLTN